MESSIYKTYFRLEREHWWSQARREIVFSLLDKYCPNLNQARVLDIGAGTGSYLEEFQKRGIYAEGHDTSAEAVQYLKNCSRYAISKKQFPEDYQSDTPEQKVIIILRRRSLVELSNSRKDR